MRSKERETGNQSCKPHHIPSLVNFLVNHCRLSGGFSTWWVEEALLAAFVPREGLIAGQKGSRLSSPPWIHTSPLVALEEEPAWGPNVRDLPIIFVQHVLVFICWSCKSWLGWFHEKKEQSERKIRRGGNRRRRRKEKKRNKRVGGNCPRGKFPLGTFQVFLKFNFNPKIS